MLSYDGLDGSKASSCSRCLQTPQLVLCISPQGFSSEQCPEGFVAVAKSTLRILAVENIGETFNQTVTRLRYTPRRLAIHPDHNTLIVAESDHAAIPLEERPELLARLGVSRVSGKGEGSSRALGCLW